MSMKVREWKGDVVFLHEVGAGPADRSYGVAVARLAGLPAPVVSRAEAILALLEEQREAGGAVEDLPLFAAVTPVAPEPKAETSVENPLIDALNEVNPDGLSPREALDLIYRLKLLSESS